MPTLLTLKQDILFSLVVQGLYEYHPASWFRICPVSALPIW